MSDLGRFLEAVYAPSRPFQSVRATIRQWHNREMHARVRGELAALADIQRRRRVKGSAPPPIREERLDAWLALPERARVERSSNDTRRALPALVVIQGDRWWERDDQGHVESSDAAEQPRKDRHHTRIPTDVERHFVRGCLREYFVCLDLEAQGPVLACGRDCVRIRAIPAGDSTTGLWPHWLPHGADEYEFHADPERGALLYIAGKYEGQVFEVCEVVDVEFDVPLDEALFTYVPQAGEQIRAPVPTVERMTVETASRCMPFVVLVPKWLPESIPDLVEAMNHPVSRRETYASLTLFYRGDYSLWITECASNDTDVDLSNPVWEQAEYEGHKMAIAKDGHNLVVALEQMGTSVVIHSEVPREQLLKLAGSLAPVS